MAVQNILFPSGRWNLDFNAAGQDLGWVEIDGNRTLAEIANNIVDTGAGTNASHAIPSPIAHVKDFKTRLDNNDEDALNEWRGMLAVIALRGARGYEVSIRDISLSQTDLGKVFFDALKDNSNVTGYIDGENVTGYIDNNGNRHDPVLTVFSMRDRNGQAKPFAMFMPSIGICPFKEYPSELFTNVPWYDNGGHRWVDLKETIQDRNNAGALTVEEVNLVNWTDSFANYAANGYLLNKFKEYIDPNNVANNGAAANNNAVTTDNTVRTIAWVAWKGYCPVPNYIPKRRFSDKLLLVATPKDTNNFRAITRDQGFAPKAFFIHANNTGAQNTGTWGFYAIPPIADEVIECLRRNPDTLRLENNTWNIEPNDDYTEFTVSYCLSANGARFEWEETFDATRIAFAVGMPYISMWPGSNFRGQTWNDYLVSILTDPSDAASFTNNFANFQVRGRVEGIINTPGVMKIEASGKDKDRFDISVVASGNIAPAKYECTSAFVPAAQLNQMTYTMIKSTSKPFALSFKYNDATAAVSLGSWVLAPVQNNGGNGQRNQKTMVVAMDFGTTSTNVYISDVMQAGQANYAPQSISSPGKYVEDIYLPIKDEGKREFYQNYYLFSKDGSSLGKICTLGQVFGAQQMMRNQNGQPYPQNVTDTYHNISGRFIKADRDYMLKRYVEGNIGIDPGIYGNLKWPTNNMAAIANNVDKARDNFISSILTSAILEAADSGANSISLRVSYPSSQLGNGIQNTINNVTTQLTIDSGLTINPSYATEAQCAGEFFKNNANVGFSPTDGYAIVDIGGGTTDISFWKEEDVQPINNNETETPANEEDSAARRRENDEASKAAQERQAARNATADNQPRRETKKQAEYSFKYAGRDIIEKTIIIFFDKHEGQFEAFWGNGDPNFKELIECYENVNRTNFANADGYYIQKGEVLNALLSDNGTRINFANGNYNELTSAISFKYLALFYLISNYLKHKESVKLSQNRFDVCLAGCGSHVIGSLRNNGFEQILRNALRKELGLEHAAVIVQSPSLNNNDKSKSEVVKGLAALPDRNGVLLGQIPDAGNAGNIILPNGFDDDDLANAYFHLVDLIKEYYPGDALISRIDEDSVADSPNTIWHTSINVTIDRVRATNCDPEIFAELFAVYMLDEVINRLL